MSDKQSGQLPYLKSLSNCLNKVQTGGYTESFNLVDNELRTVHSQHVYHPGEIKVMNTFRFEGLSAPEENAVMYLIETCDGLKGTLVKSVNVYADAGIDAFLGAIKDKGSEPHKK